MEENKQASLAKSNKSKVFLVFGVIALIIIVVVYFYIRHTKYYISTDDAYVTGSIHSIASSWRSTAGIMM
jgi:multidrug resistance efflux pump